MIKSYILFNVNNLEYEKTYNQFEDDIKRLTVNQNELICEHIPPISKEKTKVLKRQNINKQIEDEIEIYFKDEINGSCCNEEKCKLFLNKMEKKKIHCNLNYRQIQ